MPLRNFVVIALVALFSLACYSVASKNRFANLFAEALDVIDREALRDIPRRELFDSAMNGMLSDLDEHSMYISGDMFRAFDEDMKQEFGGVGMYVDNDPVNQRLVVLAPIPNTPAFKAGVQSGDWIQEISGKSTEGLARGDAVKLMRGPTGEPVTVKIERDGNAWEEVLVREVIPVPSLHGDWRTPSGTWKFTLKDDPKIAYLRLMQFGAMSVEEMEVALDEVAGEVDGLILDLRNNSGGLLEAAIQISDMFLGEKKTIVSTRGRGGRLVETVVSSVPPIFPIEKPVVVIVNRNSASASEIVAACLQDHGRAVVVGEQTWGKGTVQHVIPIERGLSALKLTTSSYWRPSGKNIDRFGEGAVESGVWGVNPEQEDRVELTEEALFENARQRNRRDLQGLVGEGAAGEIEGGEVDKPHVDKPLQRSLELMKQELGNKKTSRKQTDFNL